MAEGKSLRLSKLAREFNVGIHTIVEFLQKKGFDISSNPNTKVSADAVELLEKEYKIDLNLKKESEKISLKSHRPKQEVISMEKDGDAELEEDEDEDEEEKSSAKEAKSAAKKEEEVKPEIKKRKKEELKILGKVDLDKVGKPQKKRNQKNNRLKRKKSQKK